MPGQVAVVPPVADVEAFNVAYVGEVVTLDGRGSFDPSGRALRYKWSQTSGASVALEQSDRSTLSFTAPAVASATTLGFNLVVTSSSQLSTASVQIEVRPLPSFVTRTGSQLMLDGGRFRFTGANIYWLGLEDLPGGARRYPSKFRVDDALSTAREMGATVVRSHTLGISVGCPECVLTAANTFNEAAFESMDYAITAARARGLRLIVPLTDNYRYFHGGRFNFTDFRGITNPTCGLTCPNGNQFFTNADVIADFKAYVSRILNHVNVYTGLAYKNDPTILAWELGNELEQFPAGYGAELRSWTQDISSFLKNVAPRHLVADGYHFVYKDPSAMAMVTMDIFSSHFFPMNSTDLAGITNTVTSANKVFFVGEYDWTNKGGAGSGLGAFHTQTLNTAGISGDLFWSLWPHEDKGGYTPHDDGYTLHYPGTGDGRARAQTIRTHAFAMNGREVPTHATPGRPKVLSVVEENTGFRITWRGSTASASYSVEYSKAGSTGPWMRACTGCVTDLDSPALITAIPKGGLGTLVRLVPVNLANVEGPTSLPVSAP